MPQEPSEEHFERFMEALRVIARACEIMRSRGFPIPTIVGGAAVEHHSMGRYATGDFDFVTARQPEFHEALKEVGFRDEDRDGYQRIGLYHPDLAFGVQVVASLFFDGLRPRVIVYPDNDEPEISFLSIEDLIADRVGQFNSAPNGVRSALDQALMLLDIAEELDRDYLDKRIREESMDFDLAWLERQEREPAN